MAVRWRATEASFAGWCGCYRPARQVRADLCAAGSVMDGLDGSGVKGADIPDTSTPREVKRERKLNE